MRLRIGLVAILLAAALALLTMQVRLPDRREVGPIGSLILSWIGPVHSALSSAGNSASSLWRLYREIGKLRAENTRLREEVERLVRESALLREQAQATQRLEALLEFRKQLPGRVLGARVVGRDATRWFDVILVDRGERDGVRRNAPVVSTGGVVGRVLHAGATTSQVLLITDPRSAAGVLLQQSREAGVVQGQGQSLLRLKYISRGQEIVVGEAVVTSGLSSVFPRGLPVGSVESVVREQGAAYQEALVRPAASLNRLEEVLILLDGGPRR